MRIGIDFDNTIAGYDRLFVALAAEAGITDLPWGANKAGVRACLRRQGQAGEVEWQRLQAQAYGPRMAEAEPLEGVLDFLRCRKRLGDALFIVSHKTRLARRDIGGVDLRQTALAWMKAQGFFDANGLGLSSAQVFFEDSRDAKVARIGTLGCSHFIDDLEEVFCHPSFPITTLGYLLISGNGDGGNSNRPLTPTVRRMSSWRAIQDDLPASPDR